MAIEIEAAPNPTMTKLTAMSLDISDVLVVIPRRRDDSRGYFVETYHAADWAAAGIRSSFVQDNESHSAKAMTVRGLHFQIPPMAQAKLVRVLRGRIFDVAVDIRRGSPTYGRWCAATISAEGGEQIFVPRGFAHGFCTLEPDVVVAYKVDSYYARECDAGLMWNDPDLAINWPTAGGVVSVSERDRTLPRFRDFESPFQT
jgi:dTDP-4-dehydrorhamnose 3,5-epimerase